MTDIDKLALEIADKVFDVGMDNRTIRLSELERAREYVASSMHDRDKSWGDLVRKGERDDCPEMRMVLKAMASEAALSGLLSIINERAEAALGGEQHGGGC